MCQRKLLKVLRKWKIFMESICCIALTLNTRYVFDLMISMSLLNNLTSGQDLHWLHSGPQQEDISAQPRSPRRGSVQDLQQGALGDGPHHPRLPQRHLRAEVRVGVAAPQDVAPSQRSASEEKPREVI